MWSPGDEHLHGLLFGLVCYVYDVWLETHSLLPPGTPGRKDSLTSGCGAWLGSAVNLPPTEAHTDLTGLMVRDPGL